MNIDDLKKIDDEHQQIEELYEIFDEEMRLSHSKAARVEFLTTIHTIKPYLKNNSRILDLGAGVGEYSLFYAKLGHEVHAVEIVKKHVLKLNKKAIEYENLHVYHQSALDLSHFDDNSFDIVMLFGPLYHLKNETDRKVCILEATRVLKDTGTIFVATINNDMICLTESIHDPNYFEHGDYNKDTFKADDFPFVFFTLKQSHNMLTDHGVIIEKIVASDGLSELMAETINKMNDFSYQQYIKYHLRYCEDINRLSMTNHFLFVGYK